MAATWAEPGWRILPCGHWRLIELEGELVDELLQPADVCESCVEEELDRDLWLDDVGWD